MKRSIPNLAVCIGIILAGTATTSAVVMARRAPEKVEVESRKITNVTVQVLREKIVQDSFTVTGSLEPWKEVLLSAETSGKIECQEVEAGDRVEAGQELLKIDRASAEIRLKQARARYNLSLLELERMQQLQKGGLGTSQRMDQVQLDRDLAHADMQAREVEFRSSVVIAPFDGVVDDIYKEQEEFVSVGTPLLRLIQVHKVKMLVGIADQDILYFSVGDPVNVRVDAYKDRVFSGKIERIAGRADMSTHTFETEIELDNPERELKPGMIARATLVRTNYPNSITVPIFSIIREKNTSYVFVEEEGTAQMRSVTVGFYQGNFAQIMEGLEVGEHLIVAGHRNLRHNGLVRVRESNR